MAEKFHDVIEDTERGHERIICRTKECLSDARVRQEWQKNGEWHDIKRRFLLIHPTAE